MHSTQTSEETQKNTQDPENRILTQERRKGHNSLAADQAWLGQEHENSRRNSPEGNGTERRANASNHVESCMGRVNTGITENKTIFFSR